MKVRFSFSLDAWVITHVDGTSVEDCKEKLYKMSIGEMLEEGYIEETDIKDIDSEIVEKTVKVKATSVEYDISDWELPDNFTKEDLIETLPQELELEVDVEDDDDLDEAVANEITNKTDWCVSSCTYEVLEEF